MKNLALLLIITCGYAMTLFSQTDTIYYDTGEIYGIGSTIEGQKEGKWIWYHINGVQMSKEVYSQNKFIRGEFWDEEGKSSDITIALEQPRYPDNGIDGFTEFISRNINYPKKAYKKGVEGQVIVNFCINSEGYLVDLEIIKTAGKYLDKEAVNVIMKSPKWIPGNLHGTNVKVLMSFPVNFKLK